MNSVMKQLMLLVLSALLFGCAAPTYTVETEGGGTKVFKGYFDRKDMEEEPQFTWFKQHYEEVQYDSATVAQLIPLAEDAHFVIVMGTWCGDSKREVPHQLKLLDAIGVPAQAVRFFGVDRSKKSQDGTTEKYTIMRVPTLIVFRGEQELGRIVENPRVSQQADLLRLLSR